MDLECNVNSAEGIGVGCDSHSWSFDGMAGDGRGKILHDCPAREPELFGEQWFVGAIVGCLVQMDTPGGPTIYFVQVRSSSHQTHTSVRGSVAPLFTLILL